MKQTYRVQLVNSDYIDVEAESSEEAAEVVVLFVETLTKPSLENLREN